MTRALPRLPDAPLERFLQICAAFETERTWTEGAQAFRFAASTLVTAPGSPEEVCHAVRATAERLKSDAGWTSPMRSAIRYLIAAMLVRNDLEPARFSAACDEVEAGIKDRKLRRSKCHAVLTTMVLLSSGESGIDPAHLDRMAEIYGGMKEHHPWITNQGDYAPCALLATTDGTVEQMMRRFEGAYDGLRELGYGRGDQLQRASHLLYFNPVEDQVALARFDGLFRQFKESGLWMHGGDYDEMAILSFVDAAPVTVVDKVLQHRESIAELRPRPGKEMSFSLACGTGFVELARAACTDVTDTALLIQFQGILDAQAAAVIASTTAASAASSG